MVLVAAVGWYSEANSAHFGWGMWFLPLASIALLMMGLFMLGRFIAAAGRGDLWGVTADADTRFETVMLGLVGAFALVQVLLLSF